mgnify:CR=1 FL=1
MGAKRGRPPVAVKRLKRSMNVPKVLYEQFEQRAKAVDRSVNSLLIVAMRKLLQEPASGNIAPARA